MSAGRLTGQLSGLRIEVAACERRGVGEMGAVVTRGYRTAVVKTSRRLSGMLAIMVGRAGSRRSRVRGFGVTVATVAVLAGCGGPDDPPDAPSSTSPPAVTALPPTTTGPATTTLRGEVVAGVEPGCLVLMTDRGQYLLLGGDPQVVRAGARVVVEGTPEPDQATTCQQGTPFTVHKATPAQ
ncbi:hypothetical protein GCM10010492_59760 [Saccharothrix mutabilis subsp. mutabilis]|uniref:Lipoprotein n=2 Tax=Saccharothrix mutabilis TaxID=33921 RepID=A0ABN0UIR4_9PSEU